MLNYFRTLFLYIYRMDIPELLWLLFWCSIGFLILYRHLPKSRWTKGVLAAVLLCWMGVVLYATVGDRSGGQTFRVNLIPFHSYREVQAGGNPEIYRSNFMNSVLFYPAGLLGLLLLPEKWPGWCRCLLVPLLLGALSIGIEYLQYSYALGRCEMDDVIHNTAGALAGSLIALLLPPLLCRLRKWVLPQLCRLWKLLRQLWARYVRQ